MASFDQMPELAETPPARLVRMSVAMQELGRWAADRNGLWSHNSLDFGRALHQLLGATFPARSLQPFRLFVPSHHPCGNLYAYTTYPETELRSSYQACATPEVAEILKIETLAMRSLPSSWQPGVRCGFDVRLRPVVRLANDITTPRTVWKRHAEVDAWFARRLQHPDAAVCTLPSREEVYLDWLANLAAPAVSIDRDATRIAQLHHRDIVRGRTIRKGVDIVVHGSFVVRDADAFSRILARGIGRHRAYGYGMLLLRPAARPVPGH